MPQVYLHLRRRRNTRLRAPRLAALTTSAILRVCSQIRDLIEELDAILPTERTTLYERRTRICNSYSITGVHVVPRAVYFITSPSFDVRLTSYIHVCHCHTFHTSSFRILCRVGIKSVMVLYIILNCVIFVLYMIPSYSIYQKKIPFVIPK